MRHFLVLVSIVLIGSNILAEEKRVFTLKTAVEYALLKSKDIKITEEKLNESKGGITQAKSKFLPQVTGQGIYTRLSDVPSFEMEIPSIPGITQGGTQKIEMGEVNNYKFGLSITQPIFTWGKILNGYRIAKLNYEAQKEQTKKTEEDVKIAVIRSFYNVLLAKEYVNLAQESLKQIEDYVAMVKKRYDSGLASRYEFLTAQVELSNIKPQLLRAQDGLHLAFLAFKMSLSYPLDKEVDISGDVNYIPREVSLEKSIRQALENRVELQTMEKTKLIMERSVAIAKAQSKPNLLFQWNYSYARPFNSMPEWGDQWSASIVLSVPIFDGFNAKGIVDKANAQKREIEIGIEKLKDAITLNVRQSYLSLKESEKLLEANEQNVKMSQEGFDIAEKRYKQGLITHLEYMNSQLALMRAKINYTQSKVDCLIKEKEFEEATGNLIIE